MDPVCLGIVEHSEEVPADTTGRMIRYPEREARRDGSVESVPSSLQDVVSGHGGQRLLARDDGVFSDKRPAKDQVNWRSSVDY